MAGGPPHFWAPLSGFSHDWLVSLGVPGWVVSLVYVGIGAVSVLGAITVFVMLALWGERRFIARLQDRLGPNRVGPFGLLQSVADALKLLSKEIIRPALVDRTLHFLAPMMILGASLMIWTVIPWGPGLQVTDLNIGVLYLLAFGAIPALGVTLAGWGSTNKYSLFGGMRAVVQYVSYEVPAGIVVVVPVLLARSMSLPSIVQAQSGPPELRSSFSSRRLRRDRVRRSPSRSSGWWRLPSAIIAGWFGDQSARHSTTSKPTVS